MRHTTRTTRHNRTHAKFPPEIARTMHLDEMPHGGVRSVPQLQAWQLPEPRVWRDVLVGGGTGILPIATDYRDADALARQAPPQVMKQIAA